MNLGLMEHLKKGCMALALLLCGVSSVGFCNPLDEKKPYSFQINYKQAVSELCKIGAKYDTDKSSQRKNVTSKRHCHPYTLFYDCVLSNKRNEPLVIAELGILEGSSLLMWRDYFKKAVIVGFEYDLFLINKFNNSYSDDRIKLVPLDVTSQTSMTEAFASTGLTYDLIIEDTTHRFEDQIRVIQTVHPYLKPGGMLIIEDIFKKCSEQDYTDKLQPVLDLFQDYYFVSMDHANKCSTGWDNDKVLVLVKAEGNPLFQSRKKLTLITPSIRPANLLKLRESIDFNYVDEWIIVYDGSKIATNPQLFAQEGNAKIKEYIHTGPGISGNPQRNFALDHVENEDTYLYFLDDDNLIHKDLYKLLDIAGDNKIYTFDQVDRINGNTIKKNHIDSAMFLVDFKLCKHVRWNLYDYEADFYYLNKCYSLNKDRWVYVNNPLSFYNFLSP